MYRSAVLHKMSGFILCTLLFLVIPGMLFAGGASESASQKALVEKVDKMEMQVNELSGMGGGPSCLKCHSSTTPGFPLLGARVGYDIWVIPIMPMAADASNATQMKDLLNM